MFLLDEHLSPEIIRVCRSLVPAMRVVSLQGWREGSMIGQSDRRILNQAREEGLILVTFDLNTIPALLREFAMLGESHAGIVFVSSRSFAQNDSAAIGKALANLWLDDPERIWHDRVVFLRR